MMYHKGRKAP